MLHQFITDNRERIVDHARANVRRRLAPRPTEEELVRGVPMFLTQLVHILAPSPASTSASTANTVDGSMETEASARGGQFLRLGFTVGQVVHDYGEICQAITAVAAEDDSPISALEFRALNQALDDSVALAVTEYARRRDKQIAAAGNERMTTFAHELRDLVSAATLAFEVVQRGAVGTGGSTGALVSRSLAGIRELVDRNLAQLRLERGEIIPVRFPIAMFLEEIEIAAASEAKQRSIDLVMSPVDYAVEVCVDRQILAAAVENLLFNALHYTRAHGAIVVRTTTDAAHVRIEIEDECGGLDADTVQRALRPNGAPPGSATPRARRLSLCRYAVEACGGELHMHNRPGKGCVFSIVLPKPTPPPSA
jgi:signal transduction histidine kinase